MRRLVAVFCLILLTACGPQTGKAHVTHVVDGDTVDVSFPGGATATVRVIGIDTPETVAPGKPVQCYGPEASRRMTELVSGKDVLLETKPDEAKDKYGRLLRYIQLDGQDIGARLIAEGFARSYNVFPHPRRDAYKTLAAAAKKAKRGLWGACGR